MPTTRTYSAQRDVNLFAGRSLDLHHVQELPAARSTIAAEWAAKYFYPGRVATCPESFALPYTTQFNTAILRVISAEIESGLDYHGQ